MNIICYSWEVNEEHSSPGLPVTSRVLWPLKADVAFVAFALRSLSELPAVVSISPASSAHPAGKLNYFSFNELGRMSN